MEKVKMYRRFSRIEDGTLFIYADGLYEKCVYQRNEGAQVAGAYPIMRPRVGHTREVKYIPGDVAVYVVSRRLIQKYFMSLLHGGG